jgi:hypothetical protein
MPVLLKMSVHRPAADVPRAVFTMERAMAIPSPGLEMLPFKKIRVRDAPL